MIKFTITNGIHSNVSLTLDQPSIRIGQANDNDIILLDDGVELYHCILKYDQNSIEIDTDTSNESVTLINKDNDTYELLISSVSIDLQREMSVATTLNNGAQAQNNRLDENKYEFLKLLTYKNILIALVLLNCIFLIKFYSQPLLSFLKINNNKNDYSHLNEYEYSWVDGANLKKKIRPDINKSVQLLSNDTNCFDIKSIIPSEKAELKPVCFDEGKVELSGTVDSQEVLQAILKTIKDDMDNVTEVKLSDIVYVNEIVDFINDQVKRDHLDYDIKLISTHNKIKVALHESDYFWWSRVVKKIHLIYGDKVNLTTYHPDVNIPTIHVQAIWYGNNPFIILVNGKRYYEQSQLNEQWELKAITDNHIVITDNIKTIEIRHEDL